MEPNLGTLTVAHYIWPNPVNVQKKKLKYVSSSKAVFDYTLSHGSTNTMPIFFTVQ